LSPVPCLDGLGTSKSSDLDDLAAEKGMWTSNGIISDFRLPHSESRDWGMMRTGNHGVILLLSKEDVFWPNPAYLKMMSAKIMGLEYIVQKLRCIF
jgi:hypothetical protein